MIRVILADDHELFRDGLRAVLSTADDLSVVAQVATGTEAMEASLELRPDVLLLDVEMPGVPSVSVLHRLRKDVPSLRTLVVTMHRDRMLASQMINAGAFGFLSKAASSVELLDAIRQAHQSPRRVQPQPSPIRILSAREREVLHLIAEGRSNAEIATSLSIVVGTVKRHNSQIFAKLGAKSRTDAVRRAERLGELPDKLG